MALRPERAVWQSMTCAQVVGRVWKLSCGTRTLFWRDA